MSTLGKLVILTIGCSLVQSVICSISEAARPPVKKNKE